MAKASIGTEHVPAYRAEQFVDAPIPAPKPFVALKLLIDNWRWADVPFYLRTGKRMPKRATPKSSFSSAARRLCCSATRRWKSLMPNQLVLHIQPEEGISLQFGAKVPGAHVKVGASHGFRLQPTTSARAQHRLRAPALRLHDRRRRRCSSAPIWWKRAGPWSNPVLDVWKALPPGPSPTTPPAPGDRKEADDLLRSAMAAAGGTSRNDSGRRYWWNQRSARLFSKPGRNGHFSRFPSAFFPAASDAAAAISRAGIDSKSPLAEQAVDLFVAIYGAEAGNLALKLLAVGGIYLGGGIAPKILPKLNSPLFLQPFFDKGRMRPLVEAIPVRVISNDKIALIGAARCAQEKSAA
jgi:hypothetical protein